eukprot:jgi/Chlat1/461/Chrsp103S01078
MGGADSMPLQVLSLNSAAAPMSTAAGSFAGMKVAVPNLPTLNLARAKQIAGGDMAAEHLSTMAATARSAPRRVTGPATVAASRNALGPSGPTSGQQPSARASARYGVAATAGALSARSTNTGSTASAYFGNKGLSNLLEEQHLSDVPTTTMASQMLSHQSSVPLGFGSGAGVDDAQTARPTRMQVQKENLARQALTSRTTPKSPTEQWEMDLNRQSATPTGSTGSTLPMTPAGALKAHTGTLTDFEESEILEYSQIYFTGHKAQKVKSTVLPGNFNHGFDDERGDYNVVSHDHIGYRYEVLSTLGKGSFGQVLKCFDYQTNSLKAVKIIRNKKRFHHQALVEVKVLEHLRQKDPESLANVVQMYEYFYFRDHLCISFELHSINLYEFIKNNNFQGLSLGLIRRFAAQLLVSLKFLKKNRVIHCDLKPENILLKSPTKSAIKIIDLGSSCYEDERVYTYIQSRFYRSPEVILGLPYDTKIDMWSFGCILAELYTGYPLFPGEDETEQMACIMEVLGVPSKSLIEASSRKKLFFDSNNSPRIVANSRGRKRRPGSKDLATAIHCNDAAFVDFLSMCLKWDPKERASPEEAMQHEWITEGAVPLSTYRSTVSPFSSEALRAKRTNYPTSMVKATSGKPSQDALSSRIAPEQNARTLAPVFGSDRAVFPPIDKAPTTPRERKRL